VLLKRASLAQADGDRILALIRGTAVNHGGHAHSLTAPNPNAQAELVASAHRQAGWDPGTVSYIECHGTGTKLGDPVEVNGLRKAFEQLKAEWGQGALAGTTCWLGAVKSNLGHLESAAGIVGLLKVLLALRERWLPANLHAEVLNPYLELEGSRLQVLQSAQAWEPRDAEGRSLPRRAGVSSFGFGGANAHIALEEYTRDTHDLPDASPTIVVLSAHDVAGLHAAAARLHAFLEHDPRPGETLPALAHTLQVGREPLAERLALVISTRDELRAALAAYIAGGTDERIIRGRVEGRSDATGLARSHAGAALLEAALTHREFDTLARLWVQGWDLDWTALYGDRPPCRMSLPGYAFRPERHWIDTYQAQVASHAGAMPPPAPETPATPTRAQAEQPAGDEVAVRVEPDGIAWLTLQDRRHANMLTAGLMRGLELRLAELRANPAVRALVLTGYDQVFSMGGTRDTLLEIVAGRARCSDFPLVYRGLLACEFPVVAAMQGHAAGGGLVLGLYADLVVMAHEATYGANFVQYGFTPGMGATLVLEHKLGPNLAAEMMLTGRAFSGEELERRGASVTFRPQAEVCGEALALARLLADKPPHTLRVLKGALARRLLVPLPSVIAEEEAMHAQTVRHPEVDERVRAHFERSERFAQAAPAAPAREPQPPPVASAGARAGRVRLKSLTAQAVHAQATPPAPAVVVPAGPTPIAPSTPATHGWSDAAIQDRVARLAARVLHTQVEHLDPEQSLRDLGLDSIGAVEVVRDVNKAFDLKLEAISLYDHPSVARLARLVRSQVALAPAPPAPPSDVQPEPVAVTTPAMAPATLPAPEPDAGPDTQPTRGSLSACATQSSASTRATSEVEAVAVIGMAGRFPGAHDIEEFWANLCAGHDAVREVPALRWDAAAFYSPDPRAAHKACSKWGGFMDDVDKFDPQFFGILPADAERIDPQQRLFLEETWHALEHAGYPAARLAGSDCGVFAGVSGGDYAQRLAAAGCELDGRLMLGTIASTLPARVSYQLDLHGPAIAVDTACSSSLVAVHQACRSLLAGECSLAIAGGACVMTTPDMYVMMSKAGILAPDGRCRPFDDEARGIVPGEAVGVLILKRASDARRDGDRIYGLIRGSGVNNDGRSNGLAAPTLESQLELVRRVHAEARIDVDDIGYVEAHGTGTQLGDPIEVAALARALSARSASLPPCPIGSVKSNVGHTLNAAGVVGLIKVLLCLEHGQLVPSLHFARANAHIDFAAARLTVNTALAPLEHRADRPRLAALSSFGMSGTNAHVVVEAGPQPSSFAERPGAQLVVLSARTREALAAQVARLHAHLARDAAGARSVGLRALAYTLLAGRTPLRERLALVAADLTDLQQRLAEWAASGASGSSVFEGSLASAPGAPASEQAGSTELPELARAWVAGWRTSTELVTLLFGDEPITPVALPGYPFARHTCWITPPKPATPGTDGLGVALTPAASDDPATRARFTVTLTGQEPWLSDHIMRGRPTLPGAWCLELGYLAAEQCVGRWPTRLRGLVWPSAASPTTFPHALEVRLRSRGDALEFELTSHGMEERPVHARARIETCDAPAAPPAALDLPSWRATRRAHGTAAEFYAAFEAHACAYGPSLRRIESLEHDDNEALATLAPSSQVMSEAFGSGLLTALVDAALQTTIAVLRHDRDAVSHVFLPFSVAALNLHAPLGAATYVHARRRALAERADGTHAIFDVRVLDRAGGVVASLDEVELRAAGGAAGQAPSAALDLLQRLYAGELALDEVERQLVEVV
jgi:acyl transferase domain-containing protein/acyl carrier protein